MGEVEARFGRALGQLVVASALGVVETAPGYTGPRTEAELGYALPRRQSPFRRKDRSLAEGAALTQVDGRIIENFHSWSGLRFMMRADSLNVKKGETDTIYFTTHLGQDDGTNAVWTEIGLYASSDGQIRFFTYDPQQTPAFHFPADAELGRWYEVAIRLNESDTGPYRYETVLDGTRVRVGTLPQLANQADISHESFFTTGSKLTPGDRVIAAQGWVNSPLNQARWYSADIGFTAYVSDLAKTVRFYQPPGQIAYTFESTT
jgi:hypothetical protein